MSLLGPISTLSRQEPPTYLNLDFSKGDVPEGFSYSRSTNSGVWSKDGVYSVVGPNTPPITWVPELDSYGCAFERASTNLFTVDSGKPCGIGPFSNAATDGYSTPIHGGIVQTGIDSPDGGNSAIRVIGNSTSSSQSSNVTIPASLLVSFTIYVRQAGDLARFTVRPRADSLTGGTASWSSNVISFDFDTREFVGTQTAGVKMKARPVSRGYWEIRVSVDGNKTPVTLTAGSRLGLYLGYTGNMGSLTGKPYFDIWYGQAEVGEVPTSLIIPGTSQQARTSFLSRTPLTIPTNEFNGYTEFWINRSNTPITNGGWPFGIGGDTGIYQDVVRMYIQVSGANSTGLVLASADSGRMGHGSISKNGDDFNGIHIRSAFYSGASQTKGSINGTGGTANVNYDISTRPVREVRFGVLRHESTPFYVSKLVVSPLDAFEVLKSTFL